MQSMASSHEDTKIDLEKGITVQHHDEATNSSSSSRRSGDIRELTRQEYERLFLVPGGNAPTVGHLSHQFGNPTPLGIIAFCLCLLPTSCILMNWGTADATSLIALIGPFYYLGGVCMIITGIMEWILGNTFPMVVFMTFAGFWLSFATLNDPHHGVMAAYASSGGANSPALNGAILFYLCGWGVVMIMYFIASLRTNAVFAFMFFNVILMLVCLATAYGRMALGDGTLGVTFMKAAGGFAFVTTAGGFYLAFTMIFGCVALPFDLPVGDLSDLIPSKPRPGPSKKDS
ncbi:hypothetical protein E1B28_003978 [Marasmius oreades]|uniref:GPR1/FUN34/YaaH-class plasma membrane protein n=1 Tax=Marasmius oreades TaxID=181124 RepID=A0A9P7UXP6_9AGAR|nr:uncharacterized protein E1B28_003978 [Marasmius oreades]KAG7096556.1 hypothetical protein E1B28_003978 [Marasmius oreades]